jgi:outer membrane receptor protein involved in Fe transport
MRKKKMLLSALWTILLPAIYLLLSLPVSAQNRATVNWTDTVHHLRNVTVTANRIPKEIIPVQLLSGEQLQRLSVHSVADALRYFSGVQIKDYGGVGGLKTVNVRSLGTNHVGVFYDGIELGNAQNGVIDLGRFSLDNMEAVSLYNGQKSAIFQPAKDFASASAIYMQTRVPSFDGCQCNHIQIGMKMGSFDTYNPSLLWEHKINRKVSTSFSSEFMYTSGQYKFSYAKKNGYDTTEVRHNGDIRAVRIEGAAFGKLQDGEWKAKLYFYNSGRGYPGASVREEPGKFSHQDRQWDSDIFAQGSLRKGFGEVYGLLLNAKYGYNYLHYRSDPRLDVTTMYVDNTYRQQEAYLSAAHLFNINHWWSSSLSTDFQWNKLNADLVDFVYPNRYSALASIASSIQLEKIKMQASLLYTFVHETTRTNAPAAGDKSKLTPTVVVSYRPFMKVDFNLRAFYKRVFRMPTLNDLYYTFIGNKDLKPEYTNQYDVGLTYVKNFKRGVLQKIEFQIDGYYNEVENKIVAMPTSNQFRWTMMNLGFVQIHGVDVSLQADWKVAQVGVLTRATYTYQKAQDKTDPTSSYYGGQIPYIPWHSATLILGADYKGWDANYSFIYTGERYESSANIPENYAQPWYTSDFSLSKTLKMKKCSWRFTAEVNNIFNQQYEVVQCYPMPGTNFKFKINITI